MDINELQVERILLSKLYSYSQSIEFLSNAVAKLEDENKTLRFEIETLRKADAEGIHQVKE